MRILFYYTASGVKLEKNVRNSDEIKIQSVTRRSPFFRSIRRGKNQISSGQSSYRILYSVLIASAFIVLILITLASNHCMVLFSLHFWEIFNVSVKPTVTAKKE